MNIKPIKQIITTDGVHAVGFKIYDPELVRELEEKYKEAVEALYEVISEQAKILESINVTLMDDIVAKHIHRIEIIEKAYNKPWEEIKDNL